MALNFQLTEQFLMVHQNNILQVLINASRTTCPTTIFSRPFKVSFSDDSSSSYYFSKKKKKKSVNISEIAHKTCSVLVGGVSLGLFLMILPF